MAFEISCSKESSIPDVEEDPAFVTVRRPRLPFLGLSCIFSDLKEWLLLTVVLHSVR